MRGLWDNAAMRFAVKTAPQHTTWPDMLAVWQAADEIDLFESAWTFDHFYPIFSDSTGPCFEGWTTTTALAQATKRLRVGVLVTGMPYRHPAVLAKMAATLDIISGGRLELGIGAGWNQEEADAYGIDIHATLRERFDAFDEGCEALVGLLSNETTTFHGTYVQLENARCNPKPLQQPHPPICIGGGGERRTLRSVARFAQHWNFPGGSVEQFVAKRDVLHRHCAAIGRDPNEIMVSTHLRGGAGALDVDELVDQAKRYADAGLDLGIVYLPVPHTPDVLDEVATRLANLA
jgi:F420-dependent oxidoreductase-like protein